MGRMWREDGASSGPAYRGGGGGESVGEMILCQVSDFKSRGQCREITHVEQQPASFPR